MISGGNRSISWTRWRIIPRYPVYSICLFAGFKLQVVHRYMVDIFEKNNAELRFLNRPSFASGALCPFRCAQENYLIILGPVQHHSLYHVVFVTLDAGERLSDKKEEKRPEIKALK